MAGISSVHCIVFPTYGKGPRPGRLKVWQRNITRLAKKPGALAIIVHENSPGDLSSEERSFSDWVEERMGGRAVTFGSQELKSPLVVDRRLRKSGVNFSNRVSLLAYGQHAFNCVTQNSNWLAQSLGALHPEKKFKSSESLAWSEKFPESYVTHMVKTARPDLDIPDKIAELIARRILHREYPLERVKNALRRANSRGDLYLFLEHPDSMRGMRITAKLKTSKQVAWK